MMKKTATREAKGAIGEKLALSRPLSPTGTESLPERAVLSRKFSRELSRENGFLSGRELPSFRV